MTLWFENYQGIRRQICDCETWQEVYKSIDEFIAQANTAKLARDPKSKPFKQYYTRTWKEDGMTKIDVGSWNEFFFWENLIDNEITDKNGA